MTIQNTNGTPTTPRRVAAARPAVMTGGVAVAHLAGDSLSLPSGLKAAPTRLKAAEGQPEGMASPARAVAVMSAVGAAGGTIGAIMAFTEYCYGAAGWLSVLGGGALAGALLVGGLGCLLTGWTPWRKDA